MRIKISHKPTCKSIVSKKKIIWTMPSDILLKIKNCSKGTKMYKTRWKTIENTLQNNLILLDAINIQSCENYYIFSLNPH